MSRKNKALKWLLVLCALIAACMYFARTIQTITTPKVKLVQASTGRIEQKTTINAEPYFPVKTELTFPRAKEYPITIDKVYVKAGLYVKEGDTIFTAKLNDFDQKQDELLKSYNEKAQALIDLDIANRKSSKQSKQNDLYDLMIERQDELSEAEKAARLAAAAEGVELSFEQNTWRVKAANAGASDAVLALIAAAETAKATFETAREDFYASYENQKIKIKDEVFKYIKDRNALSNDMRDLSDDMVALLEAQQALSLVTASSEGYVVEIPLKTGDQYDGTIAAYTIAKKDDAPTLRADITELKKEVAEGARVEVDSDYDTYRTEVTAIINETDGRRYAEIELTEDVLRSAGGMAALLQAGSMEVKLVFRARKNATIIPASALRSEGSSEYVFVAEYKGGGFLTGSGMVAKKTPVTVIDRGDMSVSIQEDMGYQSIVDRADRAVEDGKPIMEYSD